MGLEPKSRHSAHAKAMVLPHKNYNLFQNGQFSLSTAVERCLPTMQNKQTAVVINN